MFNIINFLFANREKYLTIFLKIFQCCLHHFKKTQNNSILFLETAASAPYAKENFFSLSMNFF